MKTELQIRNEKQGFFKLSKGAILTVLFLTVVCLDAYCQGTGDTKQVNTALTQFIKDWFPVLRTICGLAGIYCLVMAVINIFFRGEQGGASKLVYFLLGAAILLALPFAVSALFAIDASALK